MDTREFYKKLKREDTEQRIKKAREQSESALIDDGLSVAIRVFQKRMDDYDAWYYKQDRISLAIMDEREALVDRCNWAIDQLKKAQDR